MWVYIQTEPGLFTVGFFDPENKWHGDSDGTQKECAERVHYLNGGGDEGKLAVAVEALVTVAKESYDGNASATAAAALATIQHKP